MRDTEGTLKWAALTLALLIALALGQMVGVWRSGPCRNAAEDGR